MMGITVVSCSNHHVSQGILIANFDLHCILFCSDGHFGLHMNKPNSLLLLWVSGDAIEFYPGSDRPIRLDLIV